MKLEMKETLEMKLEMKETLEIQDNKGNITSALHRSV
jgi:hypothetical protein